MTIMIIPLVAAIVVAVATGGRLRNVSARPIRAAAALGAGVVLQAAAHLVTVSDTIGFICIVASYVLLVGFALANIRLVGMPVVLVGLLLNLTVIALDSGMPVRADAIATVERDRTPEAIAQIQFDAKRHLERPTDRLTVLGDVLPVRPVHEVVSFGDLILALGLADVVFRLLRPLAAPRRRERVPAAQALAVG